jgi:hypothetical protein
MRLFWPPAILLGGQRLIATLGKVIDREAPLRQGQRYCTGYRFLDGSIAEM